MAADILILGQGLAGTLLAWELERAGFAFAIADRGPAEGASTAGAGIINPITGRRLVKSWRIDELRPLAGATYRALEAALGVPLWREMRVRRRFADARERATFAEKQGRGEFGPYAEAGDDDGFWIRDAARVDVRALLAAARARWQAAGAWRGAEAAEPGAFGLVIDCTGAAAAGTPEWGGLPWAFSQGEILELAVEGLAPDVIINRRHWIVPVDGAAAWVGATHAPGVRTATPGVAARAVLEASARELLDGRPFAVTGQRAGVRLHLPDKRPVAGRHPDGSGRGLVNGLGAKGVLWAPWLARQWARHLADGAPFDAAIDVRRFA